MEEERILPYFHALSVLYTQGVYFCEVTLMQELLVQVKENLGFVLVCITIVAALSLAAKFSERFMNEIRKVRVARRVSIIGICAAIATVLVYKNQIVGGDVTDTSPKGKVHGFKMPTNPQSTVPSESVPIT